MPSCSLCGDATAPFRWRTESGEELRCRRCVDDALPGRWMSAFQAALEHPRSISDVCPLCGTQRLQLTVTGLVGCGLCYELFSETISEHFGL